MLDRSTHDALEAFKNGLRRRYGNRLKGVFLFGSRARGNHRADSDADIAVFVDQLEDPIEEQLMLVDESYPILLATGIYIQPWVFKSDALLSPHQQDNDIPLLETIRREGVRL